MYKCDHCGRLFDENEVAHRLSRVEGWSHSCPHCGTEEFYEVARCNECGEYTDTDELLINDGLCDSCGQQALKTLTNLIVSRFTYHEIQFLRNYVDPEVIA